MTNFWSLFVIALVGLNVLGVLGLLQWFSKRRVTADGEPELTGHVWDGDLREFDNPLPRWWLILFWITAIFLGAYLVLYPGLGNFAGTDGWTQSTQYDAEMKGAEERYGPIFAAFASVPVTELAGSPAALQAGRNLFLNNCAACHGADGRGYPGFPNLADGVWLYGGSPEAILASIGNGRIGVMPAFGRVLGEPALDAVVAYLTGLGGKSSNPALVVSGRERFGQFCAACHGADAKGNQALGVPDLTDKDWLWGASAPAIRDVISKGRVNHMPAKLQVLGPERVHVLAAYVLSLNRNRAK